jgi:hypothetical protein
VSFTQATPTIHQINSVLKDELRADRFSYPSVQCQFSETSNNNVFSKNDGPHMIFPSNAILSLPSKELSNEKSQEIFNLMSDRLASNKQTEVTNCQDSLVRGDRSQDHHIFSRKTMQNYIYSYWKNFHSQLPICT